MDGRLRGARRDHRRPGGGGRRDVRAPDVRVGQHPGQRLPGHRGPTDPGALRPPRAGPVGAGHRHRPQPHEPGGGQQGAAGGRRRLQLERRRLRRRPAHRAAADLLAAGDPRTVEALLAFFDLENLAPTSARSGRVSQPQAPALAAELDTFRAAWSAGDRQGAIDGLRRYADRLAAAPGLIRAAVADAGFVADSAPWLDATALWGQALVGNPRRAGGRVGRRHGGRRSRPQGGRRPGRPGEAIRTIPGRPGPRAWCGWATACSTRSSPRPPPL